MNRPCHHNHKNAYRPEVLYLNGPLGNTGRTEPAMTIHRNPIDAPYMAQPYRPAGSACVRVPFEPLSALGRGRETTAFAPGSSCPCRPLDL